MKESKLYKLLRPLIKIFTNIVFRPTYIGLENIPKNKRIVIAGNHTNNLDCILLMSSTRRCIHFLAKIELFKGFKKIIFSNMGLIPVNRKIKDSNVIKEAEKYLNEDLVIGIFPEGTTNTKKELLSFKIGAVKMAYDTDSEIIPFAIIGKYKVFRRGLTIIFDKPYKIKSNDLDLENEKLRNKVKLLKEKGENLWEK